MADDVFRRIDALIGLGLRLARSAPSGRIALARVALSIEPDWIPRPWGDQIAAELEAGLAESLSPIAFRDVERMLRDAWGGKPTDELDALDPEPIAITPTSQVHRGELDGEPVAVKVLRPGLAAAVRQDLALLESLMSPLGAAFPALDPAALMPEVRERTLDELDLESEATAQRRFHRALRNHPFLVVPAPVTRLAHEHVLVSEWIDGVPLWRAPDPDLATERLIAFGIGAMRAGIMHADLHPDDVLVLEDGRLAILDFGSTRTVEPDRVDAAALALEAFIADDAAAFGTATERLGALPAAHAATALTVARKALGELSGSDPVRLDSAAVIAARDRALAMPAQLGELILAGSIDPRDLWPARGVAQLFGTIARVGAQRPWRELVRAALRDGWDGTLS
jgi:predicted unusual protein kinase regulating ubiquinone biosynthesis (AarF/ABC1/UbiB family)